MDLQGEETGFSLLVRMPSPAVGQRPCVLGLYAQGRREQERECRAESNHRDCWQPTDGHKRDCLGGSPP